jgi:hypothetical protein
MFCFLVWLLRAMNIQHRAIELQQEEFNSARVNQQRENDRQKRESKYAKTIQSG